MSFDDATLMAFVDGELPADEAAAIEAARAADAALNARIENHRLLRSKISAAFDPVLQEPLPQALRDIAERPRAPANVVSLESRRRQKWSVREWGAMAASIAAGLLIGFGGAQTGAPFSTDSEGLYAQGALARALRSQLASDESDAVRIGLSFRTRDGQYCRTFDLQREAVSGLACQHDDAWRVRLAAASESGGEVRMAGASAEVLAAVEALIDGEPLDADAERAARDAGWR